MEQTPNSVGMLHMFAHPVFLVKDGTIIAANQPALDLQIAENTPVRDILVTGREEYAVFDGGSLSLSVKTGESTCIAAVLCSNGGHIFHLLPEGENAQLQAMALAAQQLRDPLSNVFALADTLKAGSEEDLTPKKKEQLSQLSQNLHRLLRAVGNMSDAATYAARRHAMELLDIPSVIRESLDAANSLFEKTDRKLKLNSCSDTAIGLADRDMLERTVYNMLSNAVRHSPKGSTVAASLQCDRNKVSLTVENTCEGFSPEQLGTIFVRYKRTPSVTDGKCGLGLGIPLIQASASAHGGTLLLTLPEQNKIRFVFSIPVRTDPSATVRSPILQLDYAGGYDHRLVELSDVLHHSVYSEQS